MLNFVFSQLKAYELTEASTAKRTPVQVDQQKRKDPPKAGKKPEGHSPVQCPKVVEADKRYQLVMEKSLCFNCLSAGHSVSKYTSRYKCNICSKKHHTVLCRQGSQQPSGQSSKAPPPKDVKDLKDVNTTVMMTAEAIQFMSFMAIATSSESETPIRIRGIVDSASHRSFVTTELVQALKLKRKNSVQMQSSTFSQQTPVPQNYDVFRFELQSGHGGSAKMFEFCSIESLPTVASCSDPEVIKLLKMQKMPLAEPIPAITSDVHVLIGQDQLWQVLCSGLRRFSDNAGLISTVFGWVVSGVLKRGTPTEEN
uniref:Uncharacterized protein n=1 Tax=Strigamia maritima TaxID=126957 RepID=T1IRK5_STRMM